MKQLAQKQATGTIFEQHKSLK